MTQYSRSRQLNQFHAFYMILSYQTQIFNPHLLYHISKKRIQSSELLLCQKNTYKIRKYLCASLEIQNFYIVSFSHYLLMLSLYVPHVLCSAGCYHWRSPYWVTRPIHLFAMIYMQVVHISMNSNITTLIKCIIKIYLSSVLGARNSVNLSFILINVSASCSRYLNSSIERKTWNNAFHFSHKQNNQRCKWSALNFQNSIIMPSLVFISFWNRVKNTYF